MADSSAPSGEQHYQVRVQGQVDSRWSSWFDGLTITPEADGSTTLAGPVRDQAALHGLLARIRDLGLPLISLHRVALPCRPPHSRRMRR